MPAPSNAYLNKNINTHNNGVTTVNSRAVITDDKQTLLDRFFLDELIITKDSDGNEGFTGLVAESGVSGRYQMHNTNRIGSLRSFKDDYGVMTNYTDAGLNTLGTASLGIIYSEFGSGIKCPISYRTAYYVQTDGLKLKFRKNGTNDWTEYFVSSVLPANDNGVYLANIAVDGNLIQPNDTIFIRALNVNAEGTYESNQQTITIPRPSIVAGYGGAASSAYGNYVVNSLTTIYFSSFQTDIGTEVYSNISGTINAPAGFFANGSFWLKIELQGDSFNQKAVITAIGSIGNWGADDPATPATTVAVTFLGTASLNGGGRTWQQVCSNPAFLTEYNCYVAVATQRYVTTPAVGGEPINDGIYYISQTEFIVVQNGFKTNDGNCTDGIIVEQID